MTGQRSIEDVIRGWFATEAPRTAPDQILRSTASRVARTRQRRGRLLLVSTIGAWSPRFVGIALTAAILIVLATVGLPARLPAIGAPPTASQIAPTASASGIPPSSSIEPARSPDPNRAMDIRLADGFDQTQAYLLDGTYGVRYEVANHARDTQCNFGVAAQGAEAIPQVIFWTTLAPGSTLSSPAGRTETFPPGLYRFIIGTEDGVVPVASGEPSVPSDQFGLCMSWSLELLGR